MISFLETCPWWAWLFLGLIIGFIFGAFSLDTSRRDGIIHVTQEDDADRYLFEFNIPPEKIPRMKSVVFGVKIEKMQQQQDLQSL